MQLTIKSPKYGEFTVLFDDSDAALVAQYTWHVAKNNYAGFHAAALSKKQETIRMHRHISGAAKGQVVDHINGNTLDNRRANLRVCEQHQNACNRKMNANNKSGFKGVLINRRRGKAFIASIRSNWRLICLGQFDCPIEAANIYDDAAVELHGEFARLNFPFVYG